MKKKKLKKEIELELDELDKIHGSNPIINWELGSALFDFTTGRVPRHMTSRGDYSYKKDGGKTYLKVYKLGILFLQIPFNSNGGGRLINRYTITLEMRLDSFPPAGKLTSILQTAKWNEDEAEVYVNSEGGIGFGGSFGNTEAAKMSLNKWHLVSITIDAIEGQLITYLDGVLVQSCKPPECVRDGRFSLQDQICLFGSKINEESRGADIKSLTYHNYILSGGEIWDIFENKKAESRWSCKVCSLFNDGDATSCAACDTKREIEGDQEPDQEWSCSVCTLFNPSKVDVCSACGTPKPIN